MLLSSSGNFREKKRCLAALVESVTIQPGRIVEPVLRVPVLSAQEKRNRGHAKKHLEEQNRRTQMDSAVSVLETPVRMWSPQVEMLGIEPRSISFLVAILRAQLAGDCRECHCCQHR